MSSKQDTPDVSYQNFLSQPAVQPPVSLTQRLRTLIHKKLNPSKRKVFFYVLSAHLVIATGVLLLCPHMGVVIIPGFYGISPWLMALGPFSCLMACGFLMVAPTFLYVSLLFKSEVLKVLYRSRWILLSPIIVLTLTCLLWVGRYSTGVEVCGWLLGAGVGGFLTFEIGIRLNKRFLRE